ncbi:MAG: hypothetical protein IKO93_15035 [Lentisphaeria bacterium]|nr:hypothetical protein [Lentisphaeria bacterium]
MIELVVIIIILIVIGCVKIHRATQRQAAKEREYLEERQMCGCAGFCLAYAITKAILILIAAGAIFYIFVSLAIGETIGLRHLGNSDFWITAIGSVVIFLPTIGLMVLQVRKK